MNINEAFQQRMAAHAVSMQQPWPAEDGPAVTKSIDTALPVDAGIKKVFNLACARLIWLQFAKDKSETARLKVVRESLATIFAFIQASGIHLADALALIVQEEEVGSAALVTDEDTAVLDALVDEMQHVQHLSFAPPIKAALMETLTQAFDSEMDRTLAKVAARAQGNSTPLERAKAAMEIRYPRLKPAGV